MRPVGVGRLFRHNHQEAVGEGVLDGGADTDIGLDARDNDPLDPLFAQEEREVGGEEGAIAALVADDLAWPRWLEASEKGRVRGRR